MTSYLLVIAGPEKGRTFSIEDGQILVIGRGQASNTQINDPHMSRVHCEVRADGGKTTLVDAGSTGGTFVGGRKITHHELRPGDVFQVGDSQIRYQLDPSHDQTTLGGGPQGGAAPQRPLSPALEQLVGQNVAHYRLDKLIASGHSGAVFKAHDTEQNRTAAVKVLNPDPSHSEEQKERFVRAMKTMLPVKHPHIVELYNAGKSGPFCWAAMAFIDGESLTSVIERIGIEGMLDWKETFRVAVHVARALEEAHRCKIIHRNVTPANILRRTSDKCCLLGDLMLAKAVEGSLARQVTLPGQLVGDVPFMAPERTRDASSVDHRADLYGLGATLYALLTGSPPFESKSLSELVKMIREAPPRKPKEFQLAINDMFQDIVLKLLSKRPEDRYEEPADLLRDLERVAKFNALKFD
jgi:serine/threonine protein kinase